MFTSTKYADAYFFIDDQENQLDRDQFLTLMERGRKGFMIHLRAETKTARVAVIAGYDWEALNLVESWAEDCGHPELVNRHFDLEDPKFGRYEWCVEIIPRKAVTSLRLADAVERYFRPDDGYVKRDYEVWCETREGRVNLACVSLDFVGYGDGQRVPMRASTWVTVRPKNELPLFPIWWVVKPTRRAKTSGLLARLS